MDAIGVELSKINFLLENLYALTLRNMGATSDEIPVLADEIRRQATELPATSYGKEPSEEEMRQHTEMVGQRLDMFFAAVRERMQTAEQS